MLLPPEVAVPSTNPFTPDFGQAPHALVGRDALLSDLLAGLATGPTDERFSTILLGPRGSGKTVIQTEVEQRVAAAGWLVLSVDSSTPGLPDRVRQAIARARDTYERAEEADPDKARRARWSGINLGPVGWHREVFEAVRPDWDMRHQMTALAEHAARSHTAVLLTVDELQAGDTTEQRRLASDLQQIIKKQSLPLAFLGAGLSEMKHTLLTSRRLTFFHRCARMEMPPLTRADAMSGIGRTIREAGGNIHGDALDFAAEASGGLPYKLQLVGHNAWSIAGAPDHGIDLAAARSAVELAEATMDERLSVPAWHDLGDVEQAYLHAVAQAGDEADHLSIAQAVQRDPRTLVQTEERLRSAGYITDTPAGGISLTDLMPRRVVVKSAAARSRYRATGRAPRRSRCNEYMPRTKAKCVLPEGHSGGHRSGRRRT